MGVAADGSYAGSLSGGCIEGAVVAEALDALKAGKARVVRFGAGSPYVDIRLPCGGGVDVHFQPLRGRQLVDSCMKAIAQRTPFYLDYASGEMVFSAERPEGENALVHWPLPRLEIVGHGAGVPALARLASVMGIEARCLSPDDVVLDTVAGAGLERVKLARTSDTHLLRSDAWTALAFLFHDHDWEEQLIARALDMPHFYIGAMGSRKAHEARVQALRLAGAAQESIAAIKAPIGLFHSVRDPDSLALSTLGEITLCYHHYCAALGHG